MVSRFVQRAIRHGLLRAERLHGIGMNRLRLTSAGRDIVIARGVATADELFAPARAVALKDLAHTLAINDLAVALRQLPALPARILPAWFLARQLGGAAEVIPDLLAVWMKKSRSGLRLACEIDLGAERLAGVFLPKLERLITSLDEDGSAAGILILTRGDRRLQLLADFAARTPIPVMPFLLPETGGPDRIRKLREIISVD
ncbi:MAG TPA: replication-relaxation family protein [Thermoanaerobaculia bacterium]|nr:replication-relaxation family protein [Thermoanaerobaculia bacterium]